jgi:hypothetical protein
MPLVQASLDGQTLAVTTSTAKEAVAQAVEWQVVGRCTNTYSTDAFALAMALLDIAKTVNGASEGIDEVRC